MRCKFKVDSVTHLPNDARSIEMSPVTGGSDENKTFWKWTPSGKITLYSVNAAAVDQYKPGDEVYVDLTLPIRKED